MLFPEKYVVVYKCNYQQHNKNAGFGRAFCIARFFFRRKRYTRYKKPPPPAEHKNADELKLENPQSFSFILFGDPQNYAKFDFNQPLFEYMTAWTAAQKKHLNVKTVLCTGDLVEQNDNLVNGGQIYAGQNCGNQPSTLQWQSASRAFERLDNVYPYILATGNHDYGYDSSEVRRTRFTEFFDIARNHKQWGEHLVATFPNGEGRASLENAAYAFVCGNWKLLVVSLEFTPRDEVLRWAKSVCERKEFGDFKVIILTHSILRQDGAYQKDKYKMTCNRGEDRTATAATAGCAFWNSSPTERRFR